MKNILHVDIDIPLSQDLRYQAIAHAIAVNAANAPDPNVVEDIALAVDIERKWLTGKVLRIRFLEGHPIVQQRVMETAKEWTQYANLTFDFGDHSKADIRITFKSGYSCSYVGTDATLLDLYEAQESSMNFGWLEPDSPQEIYSAVVLHEFGHAIGCIHEHQTPTAGIKWNKPVVYKYFRDAMGWDKAMVDHNVFYVYAKDVTQHSTFDPTSIMAYPIQKAFTLDGYEVPWNSKLSEMDKSFIASKYP